MRNWFIVISSLFIVISLFGLLVYVKYKSNQYVGRGTGMAAVKALLPKGMQYEMWDGVDFDGDTEPEIIIRGYQNNLPQLLVYKFTNSSWKNVFNMETQSSIDWKITRVGPQQALVVLSGHKFAVLIWKTGQLIELPFPDVQYTAGGGTLPKEIEITNNGRITTLEGDLQGIFRIEKDGIVIEKIGKR